MTFQTISWTVCHLTCNFIFSYGILINILKINGVRKLINWGQNVVRNLINFWVSITSFFRVDLASQMVEREIRYFWSKKWYKCIFHQLMTIIICNVHVCKQDAMTTAHRKNYFIRYTRRAVTDQLLSIGTKREKVTLLPVIRYHVSM